MLKEKHLVKTDFYKVNIDTAKNVSLGANKSTAVVVPEVTCTAFEKIDVKCRRLILQTSQKMMSPLLFDFLCSIQVMYLERLEQ